MSAKGTRLKEGLIIYYYLVIFSLVKYHVHCFTVYSLVLVYINEIIY